MIVPSLIAAATLIALFPVQRVSDCGPELGGNGYGLDILLPCPPGVKTVIGLTYSGYFISGIIISVLIAGSVAVSAWSLARIGQQDRP